MGYVKSILNKIFSERQKPILALSNFAANGAIGLASATVDKFEAISINQTTADIVLTIPSPTVATNAILATISNVGTVSVVVASEQINAGESVIFVWSGTAWKSITAKVNTEPITYGRVVANSDLASIAYDTAGVGTPINFDQTLYSAGVTFSGTNGIIPSASGRYAASFFAMGGSGEFNGDGIFHIVQGGSSMGNIPVDIMQAAGVNQISPFIEVDLVAGLPVTLNYQPLVADAVPWGRGSYFQLRQLPESTVITAPTTGSIILDDQSLAGYFDFGGFRVQRGEHNDGNVDTTTVTLPTPFADTNYVVIVTNNGGNAISASVEAKTTTTFDIDRATSAVSNTWGWIAIGLK